MDRTLIPPIHILPCSIKFEGEAKVAGYFQPSSSGRSVDGLPILSARFRGRILQGAAIPVPGNFAGYITKAPAVSSDSVPPVELEECFKQVVYWNSERPPSKGDPLQRCLEWLDLSQEVHSHVSPEEVAAEMDAKA